MIAERGIAVSWIVQAIPEVIGDFLNFVCRIDQLVADVRAHRVLPVGLDSEDRSGGVGCDQVIECGAQVDNRRNDRFAIYFGNNMIQHGATK